MKPRDSTVNSIRILGVSGSPREASTAYLVKEGLKYAEKSSKPVVTEFFSLKGKTINFCVHCDYCVREKKGCVHNDDMLEAYEKIARADAFFVGSPVYNGSISGQLKTFFDRCRAIVAKNPDVLRNKVGAGLAVPGRGRGHPGARFPRLCRFQRGAGDGQHLRHDGSSLSAADAGGADFLRRDLFNNQKIESELRYRRRRHRGDIGGEPAVAVASLRGVHLYLHPHKAVSG